MTQQDHELAKKIVQHLDNGADQLDEGIRGRLLAARKLALSHYEARTEPVWSLAGAGSVVMRFSERRFSARYVIATAALIAGMIGIVYWQTSGPSNESPEIDLGLLTDDLPINAYLDRGFDSWLKRSPR